MIFQQKEEKLKVFSKFWLLRSTTSFSSKTQLFDETVTMNTENKEELKKSVAKRFTMDILGGRESLSGEKPLFGDVSPKTNRGIQYSSSKKSFARNVFHSKLVE